MAVPNYKVPTMKQPAKNKTKGSKKLLFLLLFFFITLLLVLFFHSSFSKINHILIEGEELATEQDILGVLKVEQGDQYFLISTEEVRKEIEKLPTIQKAIVTKKFPGELKIRVQENPVVGLTIKEDQLRNVLSSGYMLPLGQRAPIMDKPILSGWEEHDALYRQLCKMLSGIAPEDLADISEIKPAPTAAFPDKLLIYTRSQYEVESSISLLPQKVKHMDDIIRNLRQEGIVGGRITMLLVDYHTPFGIPSAEGELDAEGMPVSEVITEEETQTGEDESAGE